MGGSREAPQKCCLPRGLGQPRAHRESSLRIWGPRCEHPCVQHWASWPLPTSEPPGFITALVVTACVMSGKPLKFSELLQTPL